MAVTNRNGYSLLYLRREAESTVKVLMCDLCNLVMRDPLRTVVCNHKFCSRCFESLVEASANCPGCEKRTDATPINEGTAVYSDVVALSDIATLPAACPTCLWKGKLLNTDDHECSMLSIESTEQLKATHKLIVGCSEKIDRIKFQQSEMRQMKEALAQRTSEQAESISSLEATVTCLEKKCKLTIEKKKDLLRIKEEKSEAAREKEKVRLKLAEKNISLVEKGAIALNHGQKKKHEILERARERDRIDIEILKLHIKRVEVMVESLNKVNDLCNRFDTLRWPDKHSNGLFTWRIPGFDNSRLIKGNSIISPTFSSGQFAFVVSLGVQERYISLTINMAPSQFNGIQKWPIDIHFAFGLLEPSRQKNCIYSLSLTRRSILKCEDPGKSVCPIQCLTVSKFIDRADAFTAIFDEDDAFLQINLSQNH